MTAPDVMEVVSTLNEDDIEKVYDFATFLRHISDREDEEDTRAIFERMNEPDIPFDVVKKEFDLV